MTFFYDLNKKLADLAKKQDLNESVGSTSGFLEGSTGDYSAKKARAGKDIGKPGKMFSKIAKSAGERYGSKERGEKVAGAVLAKLRAKEDVAEADIDEGKFDVDNALGDIYNKAVGSPIGNAYNKIRAANYDRLANKNPNDPQAAARAQKAANIRTAVADKNKLNQWNQHMMASSPSDWSPELERQKKANVVAHYKESVEESDMDESKLQAYLGKKKYGDEGMKALQKAGREHAGKEKMNKIRAKYDKMDEADLDEVGRGEWIKQQDAKAEKSGKGKFKAFGQTFDTDEIDEKKEPRSKGTAFDKEHMEKLRKEKEAETHSRYDVKDTGYSKRYTRKAEPEDEQDDEVKSDAPKTKGRPKGSKRAIGAKGPTGKSKLLKKDAIKEMDIALIDKGEYDREGEMAKQQIHTIMRAAKKLHSMLGDDENLPEWVQKKITLAQNYIDGVADYMASQRAEAGAEQPIAEKAVSQQQQKFMGMVHAMQKGDKIKGASPELKKVAREMPKKAAKDYAATKHAGLPKKVKEEGKPDFLDLDKDGNKTEPMKQAAKQAKHKGKEEADESAEAPKETKSKGGYQFGKGIYESMDNKFRQALTEGMNISVNMNTGPNGEPTKNITVSADGDDAEALAALLKMAGIGHKDDACPGCGKAPCGCEKELDENSPDWPTNTETSDDALQYSGGLNGPKSTGQTTVPVIASQLRRQVSMEESVELERSLFKLYQNYKAK